jgi:hypothetical protein
MFEVPGGDPQFLYANLCDYPWAISKHVNHCCALPPGHSGRVHVCSCRATHEAVHATPA